MIMFGTFTIAAAYYPGLQRPQLHRRPTTDQPVINLGPYT
jgi:hypothetical protein